MKWVSALDLQQWSATLEAREAFPGLIGDLIRASALEITSFRFPKGDKAQVRGFDGWLEAKGATTFVPDGLSIWEFGVHGSDAAKALADFKKRTSQVDEAVQRTATFVFASPDTWDNSRLKLQDWIRDRQAESSWKDVRYLEGSQIEAWLETSPAVAAQFAQDIGKRPLDGARGAEQFWDEYTLRFKTKLSEEVLIAGREAKASEVLEQLLGSSSTLEIAADSPDEVIAFVIAAVRKADPSTRRFLENRILVLDNEHAARFFANSKNLIFFPRAQAASLSGLLAANGTTLFAKGRDQTRQKTAFLDRPSIMAFAKSLETMGIGEQEAYDLAIRCGRSMAALARQYAGGNTELPPWVADGHRFLPALLAGSWDASNQKDKGAVAGLIADSDFNAFEVLVRSLAKQNDPPFDIEGTFWKVRAPVDVFVHLAHLITGDDLERLKALATDMFSEIGGSPDPNAPFEPALHNQRTFSSWLRDGIANTLLQIAVLSKQSDFNVPGVDPQAWVDEVVGSLPGLRTNGQLIASLRNELWTLMEAAPRPLLSALEQLLKGDSDVASVFFSADENLFAPTSPHVYLLWALETLAWDPRHLQQVSNILARLALIDPGGRHTNRPINSLRSIFLPWAPNTHATLAQRLQVLARTMEVVPEASWPLALTLLPKAHDSNDVNRKPKFREAGASQAQILTNGMVWDAQEFAIDSVMRLVGDDSGRWVEILDRLYNWTPKQRARAAQLLNEWFATTAQNTKAVWTSLNELINKHIAFAATDWAIPQDELSTLRAISEKYAPVDVVERVSWLFDRWSRQMAVQFEANDEALEKARSAALLEVMELADDRELLRLVDVANEPTSVAVSLGSLLESSSDFLKWIVFAVDQGTDRSRDFARVLTGALSHRFEAAWRGEFETVARSGDWSGDTVGFLLLNLPDGAESWDYIDSFGEAAHTTYWRKRYPFRLEVGLSQAIRAIETYLSVGRAAAAIKASHNIRDDVPTNLIVSMMRDMIGEMNTGEVHLDGMTEYYIEHLFSALDKKADVDETELAKLEYAYLPMLERSPRRLVVHKLMARSPEFYVSLLESVFAPASQEKSTDVKQDVTDAQRAKARNDYRLLHDFQVLPGSGEESIDFETLNAWISKVRQLARESDREVIGDIYVGHVLARAPEESGIWPPTAVCRVIEEQQSDDIPRGIAVERMNLRGVYSKSLDEGGKQERQLAERYRNWGNSRVEYPTTAAVLERIAESYDRDAEREDERAAIRKMQD
jgi:hypothetical protein